MGRADSLEAEGVVLQGMYVSHVRAGHEPELPVIRVSSIWTELGKTVAIVGPRSHKAFQAKGGRGNVWKDIKRMGRNAVWELRNKSRGRWGCIPSVGGRISVRRRGKIGGGRVRMYQIESEDNNGTKTQ
jgi:hypothetical protein